MILYFDNYITDEPLFSGLYSNLNDLRNSCSAYKMPDKLSIAMYTLASYAVLDWSDVIIKYDLQDKSKTEKFESFVRSIFPKAKIIQGRSDTQEKFKESLKMIREANDEWIFYAGNVDHPFVASETKTLAACLSQAKKLRGQFKMVSIHYSHFGELQSMARPNTYTHNKNAKVVEEDENCISVLFDEGKSPVFFESAQVVHRDMMEHWFASKPLAGKRVIRAESVSDAVDCPQHALVIPKNEVCAHFDGYSHIKSFVPAHPDDIMPPLFIPGGFFEGKMRLAFGYPDYREGWVNINPAKERYSFRDKANGTDIKLIPECLPLFWKGRIAQLDINPQADMDAMRKAYKRDIMLRANPWPCSSAFDRTRRRIMAYPGIIASFAENPERLDKYKNSGNIFQIMSRNALYAVIIASYKVGVIKKKPQAVQKKAP